jgi:hypothetical protein
MVPSLSASMKNKAMHREFSLLELATILIRRDRRKDGRTFDSSFEGSN